MNKLVATAGSGSYEFQSPDRVRCLICAEAHPKAADKAKGRGGSQVGGEAIIRLRRPYDVHKIVNQKIGSKKSQIGHHHVVHGSMQPQAKKGKSKGVDELVAWKTVFGLQRHPALDENPSLPPIHHILSMKKAAETVQGEQRVARVAKMLQLWEVRCLHLSGSVCASMPPLVSTLVPLTNALCRLEQLRPSTRLVDASAK